MGESKEINLHQHDTHLALATSEPSQSSSRLIAASPHESALAPGAERTQRSVALSLDDIPAPLLGLNKREQVVATNAEARRLLGLRGDAWRGQPIQALLNFTCNLYEEFCEGPTETHTHRLNLSADQDSPTPLTLTIRRAGGAGLIHYVCILSSGEISHTTGPESSDQLAAMGQMIAGFAHEVRNPLAALKSIIEDLAADSSMPRGWENDLGRLNLLTGRIERLMRSSLRLVRSERPNRREHDVGMLASNALELLRPRLRETKGSTITVTNRAAGAKVVADENQIVQVLVILLENAIDACGRADRVRIVVRADAPEPGDASEEASSPSRRVYIDVEDDGPGISADMLSKIWNPFFTGKPRGTGLGLSIALKLARENFARISVKSVVGKGCVFSLELPGAP